MPTRTIPASKTKPERMENDFIDDWNLAFGKSAYSLTGNGPQILSKLFSSINGYLSQKMRQLQLTIHRQTARPSVESEQF